MKRLTSILLAMALTLSMVPAALADSRPATTFSDLPTNHWGYTDIMSLYQGGLVKGMGNGEPGPDKQLTVSQLATMIANAQGVDVEKRDGEAWFVRAIQYAINIGILPSDTDPTSEDAANKLCSREQAVYMVINGLGIANGLTKNDLTANDIPDYDQISNQYKDAALTAVQYGIIKGKGAGRTFPRRTSLLAQRSAPSSTVQAIQRRRLRQKQSQKSRQTLRLRQGCLTKKSLRGFKTLDTSRFILLGMTSLAQKSSSLLRRNASMHR